MKKFTAVLTKEVKLLICDGCGLQANNEDTEFHEFISVKHSCGYGSIHGDGNEMTIDLCQHCFAGMCGDILTVTSNSTCDISDDIKNILSANEITNNKVLKSALKRVEQLWDAQYHSTEGNELHQLAELISTYENKSWEGFFNEVPLADDDFMPGRLNFIPKDPFKEEKG